MPGSIEAAVNAIIERGGAEEHRESVRLLRRDFERRTGAFGPDDAWFESRSKAFWDDALLRGFVGVVKEELGLTQEIVRAFENAHRGLFAVHRKEKTLLECAVTGAVLAIDPPTTPGLAEALDRAEGFVQGFVVGTLFSPEGGSWTGLRARSFDLSPEVVLLPGAVFHAAQATQAIEGVIAVARQRGIAELELLDALLRMDRTFRAMPRAKAQLAYRPEALEPPRLA